MGVGQGGGSGGHTSWTCFQVFLPAPCHAMPASLACLVMCSNSKTAWGRAGCGRPSHTQRPGARCAHHTTVTHTGMRLAHALLRSHVSNQSLRSWPLLSAFCLRALLLVLQRSHRAYSSRPWARPPQSFVLGFGARAQCVVLCTQPLHVSAPRRLGVVAVRVEVACHLNRGLDLTAARRAPGEQPAATQGGGVP